VVEIISLSQIAIPWNVIWGRGKEILVQKINGRGHVKNVKKKIQLDTISVVAATT